MKNYNTHKRNERIRKTKRRRRSDDEYTSPNETKVSQEKGTRIGGSTTHLLSEPGTHKVQGIETFHTPPPLEEAMTPQMERYKAILQKLVEVNGDGLSYSENKQNLIKNIKVGEVVAVRCPDNNRYYRTILLKKLPHSSGHQALISNAVYGDIPFGMPEVKQEHVFRRIRELNASTTNTLDAFPHSGLKDTITGADGASLVSSLHRQQLGRNGK